MTPLQHSIRAFRFHLMLRLAGFAALSGLVIALVIVIAAPWLRDAAGLPGYWLTFLLPVLFPAAYVVLTLMRRPNERTTVLAADAWCQAEGSIVSAWELEREDPDSPFVKPVALRAIEKLQQRRLPEPPLMRKLMVAMIVLLALVWPSRLVHAELQESEEEEKAEELSRKVDVPPKEAEKLAQEAGSAAELAKDLGAKPQEKLADDLEAAARNAQAGGQDKERALREANNLVDRARAQSDAQENRDDAREAMKARDATRELAEAIEATDKKATDREARELSKEVFRPDGTVDEKKARELQRAIESAREEAPQDPRLRRAAEQAEAMLDEQNLKNAKERREERKKEMEQQGMDPAAIEEALSKLQQMDQRALEEALKELADAASPLRDMDANGKEMEELLKKLESGAIDPEEAKRLAEAARQLSERLELDAEALREMLKEGREFEGLDKAAEKMLKNRQGEPPAGPGEIPEWAKGAVPEEWVKEWADRENAERNGGRGEGNNSRREGGADGEGNSGEEGDGTGGGKGDGKTGDPTRKVDGEGKEEGIDTGDTGEGEKDPNKDPERLDPNKAGDEKALREASGRDGDSSGINTRDEEERLPRRYRDAARKYFER